jgi:hypothetical protein
MLDNMPYFPTLSNTGRLLSLNAGLLRYFPIFRERTVEWQTEKPSRSRFSQRLIQGGPPTFSRTQRMLVLNQNILTLLTGCPVSHYIGIDNKWI